jgi:hypothetical protein
MIKKMIIFIYQLFKLIRKGEESMEDFDFAKLWRCV